MILTHTVKIKKEKEDNVKKRRLTDPQFGALMSLPGLAIILLWVGIPMALLIIVSFLRYDIIHPLQFAGFKNYIYLFEDRIFRLAVKKTLIFFSGSTFLTCIIALPAAWFLSRVKKGGTLLRTLIMFSWAVPPIVSGFIWGWILNASYGVLNHILISFHFINENINFLGKSSLAMISVIVADAWIRVPFMTIIALAGFNSISKTIYEAAEIDGADIFCRFRHISLPLAKGSILTGLLITSIFTFRSIDTIFSLTKGGPGKATYVLGLLDLDYIYNYMQFGYAGTVSMMMLLLCFSIAGIYIYFIWRK